MLLWDGGRKWLILQKEWKLIKDKNREVNFLRWAEQNDIKDYFLKWTEIDHPDFPGNKVDVEGIALFKMLDSPVSIIDEVSNKHNEFIMEFSLQEQ